MEKYESRQHKINRPASQVYAVLADFTNFTPIIHDKVENWQATENTCSFRVKGITMRLNIVDKAPFSYIKFSGDEGMPMEFSLWIQLKEVAPYDTRMRVVAHAQLNMMMKMMLGSKLQEGIEAMAEQIANAFNGVIPEGFDPSAFAAMQPDGIRFDGTSQDLISQDNPAVEVPAFVDIDVDDYTNIDLPHPDKPAS